MHDSYQKYYVLEQLCMYGFPWARYSTDVEIWVHLCKHPESRREALGGFQLYVCRARRVLSSACPTSTSTSTPTPLSLPNKKNIKRHSPSPRLTDHHAARIFTHNFKFPSNSSSRPPQCSGTSSSHTPPQTIRPPCPTRMAQFHFPSLSRPVGPLPALALSPPCSRAN
jgi:hypothetical protein